MFLAVVAGMRGNRVLRPCFDIREPASPGGGVIPLRNNVGLTFCDAWVWQIV